MNAAHQIMGSAMGVLSLAFYLPSAFAAGHTSLEGRSPYEILGVDLNANAEQIQKAYRHKALKLHPDKLVGLTEGERKKSEKEFILATESYEILTDPERRQEEISNPAPLF